MLATAPPRAGGRFYCDRCQRVVLNPRIDQRGAIWCQRCPSAARRLPNMETKRLMQMPARFIIRSADEGRIKDRAQWHDDPAMGRFYTASQTYEPGAVVVNYLMFERFSLRAGEQAAVPLSQNAIDNAIAAAEAVVELDFEDTKPDVKPGVTQSDAAQAPFVPKPWKRQPWNEYAVPVKQLMKERQLQLLMPDPDSPPELPLAGGKRPREGPDEAAAPAKKPAGKKGKRLAFTTQQSSRTVTPAPHGSHSPDKGSEGSVEIRQPAVSKPWQMLKPAKVPLTAEAQAALNRKHVLREGAEPGKSNLSALDLANIPKVQSANYVRENEYVAALRATLSSGGFSGCPSCGGRVIHQRPCAHYPSPKIKPGSEDERMWYGPCDVFAVRVPKDTCEAWNQVGPVLEGGKLATEKTFDHHETARRWLQLVAG